MKKSLDRSFYIPTGSTEIKDPESDAVAYLYNIEEKLVAMGFCGKGKKPVWHYYFSSKENRDKYVDKLFSDRQYSLARKEVEKKERALKVEENVKNTKVGDIYYSSWGYDQTNIDFYKIVAKKGSKSFMLQEIGQTVDSNGSSQDLVMPYENSYKGRPVMKRMGAYGFNLNSYSIATKWDGKPKHQTAIGYGH